MTEKQRANSEVRRRGAANSEGNRNNNNELVFSKKNSFNFTPEFLSDLHDKKTVEALDEVGGIEGISQGLETDLKKGLSSNDVEKHREAFGSNAYEAPPVHSILSFVLEALQDRTLIILLISAAVSLSLGIWNNPSSGWIEGAAILFAVVLVVSLTSFNNYKQEQQFIKLSEVSADIFVEVIRDGTKQRVSIKDVVVGDVVDLSTGQMIPADGLVTTANSMRVDESSITGECNSKEKTPQKDPFAISGCQVVEGYGRFLVTAVGHHSTKGRIRQLLIKPPEMTPLQKKLEDIADTIGKVGLAVAILTFAVLSIKTVTRANFSDSKLTLFSEFTSHFIAAITIVVVAVPEGLPLAVTISLAYSMMKMLKDRNLVRHLEACETMGGATNICSDKTGTLTENEMTAVKLWIGGSLIERHKNEHHADTTNGLSATVSNDLDESVKKLLAEAISLNTRAYLSKIEGKSELIGSKTEVALLKLIKGCGAFQKIREEAETIATLPFSSDIKRTATLAVITENGEKHYKVFTTGAPEIVIPLCSKILSSDGKTTQDIDADSILQNVVSSFTSHALRTVCIAYKEVTEDEAVQYEPEFDIKTLSENNELEKDLTLIGIVGIKDPLRKEVTEAVHHCKTAGIMVRLITGDNLKTAVAIAEECGIKTPDGVAMEGPEFRKLSDEEVDKLLPKLQVLARSSPIDKHRLVHHLRKKGEVVAVTGDGTNDAPSLKEADVGFSMGLCGTEVAKAASDIILLDDNFSTIVKAIMWGRNVYDSIRKFLQFQLTVNLVALVTSFVSAICSGKSVLTPVQMLWINLIMDTMGALALATDEPSNELLKRKPYGRRDRLVTSSMAFFIVIQCCYQLICMFVVLFEGDSIFGVEQGSMLHNTIVFNTFVLMQVVNEVNCRKVYTEMNVLTGITKNPIFIGIVTFTLAVQYAIIQWGGKFTFTAPLTLSQWMMCAFFASLGIPTAMIARMIASKLGLSRGKGV